MALPRQIAPPLAALVVLAASTGALGQPFVSEGVDRGSAPCGVEPCVPACWGAASWGNALAGGPTWVPRAWMTGSAAWQPVIEPEPIVPETGYVDATLSTGERRALRRSLKLPLDALEEADSTDALKRLAVVQPLPNPSKPFLPVAPIDADERLDPFATNRPSAASRSGLGALSRLFDAEDLAAGIAPKAATAEASGDAEADPFAVGNEGLTEPTAEPAAEEDPFAMDAPADESAAPDAGSDDPLGAESTPEGDAPPADDEDPFGDF